jgi:CheY-like chemotaxis protein
VKDTGVGMSEETRSRIFEPFFTTKERGQGTGLGLAVVYGIVQGHNGYIHCESTPGRGTTFYLFLPVGPERLRAGEGVETPREEILGGSETILLVEDEDFLREQVEQALVEKGYRVLTATDGEEAVHVFDSHASEIRLVVMDMGLPKRAGWDALKHILRKNPAMPAIAASGFFDPIVRSDMASNGVRYFLQKPYLPEELLLKAREILDAVAGPSRPT